jgi:uncharacterized protein (UPF0262 family)
MPPDASSYRLASVKLDEKTFVRRQPEAEHERAIAIYDLIEDNYFKPADIEAGPYSLTLCLEDNRLIFEIGSTDGRKLAEIGLPMTPFRTIIKDYFMVCESYYSAIKRSTPAQIEAIDAGRRGLHNEGSETLRERLAGKIEIDNGTARRLFTLICILHLRG